MIKATSSRRIDPWCREVVGCVRLIGERAYEHLSEVLRFVVNYIQPSFKLQEIIPRGDRGHRVYDLAQTPLQRLLASGVLSEERKRELSALVEQLDPLVLSEQLACGTPCYVWPRRPLWRRGNSHPWVSSCMIFALSINPNTGTRKMPGPQNGFGKITCLKHRPSLRSRMPRKLTRSLFPPQQQQTAPSRLKSRWLGSLLSPNLSGPSRPIFRRCTSLSAA